MRWWRCACYDPMELNLPPLGLVVLQDAETGEQLFVDTQDSGFRQRSPRRRKRASRTCARPWGARAWIAWSWRPTPTCMQALLRFIDLRKRRSRLAAGAAAPPRWPEPSCI